jgi:kynurenine formamidase
MRLTVTLAIASVVFGGSFGAAPGQDRLHASAYGPDDVLGAANNLSSEGVRRALRLVTTGKVYSLAIVTGPDTPAYGDRKYSIKIIPPPGTHQQHGPGSTSYHEEIVTTSMGIGTQIDGLGHIGIDDHYYNGRRGAELNQSGAGGLKVYGTENIPPIVTRGIVIDVAGYFGKQMLTAGTEITGAHIRAAMKAQKISVGRGDVVLLHTGWMRMIPIDPKAYASTQPGLSPDAAVWLSSLGVVAVGLDTVGLEPRPTTRRPSVHQTLITKHGIYPLEGVNTAPLLADGVKEFLFVLGVPRFQGAAQMVINPVAIR